MVLEPRLTESEACHHLTGHMALGKLLWFEQSSFLVCKIRITLAHKMSEDIIDKYR